MKHFCIFAFAVLFAGNVFCADNDVYLSLSSQGSRSSIGLADFVPSNGFFEEMELSKQFKQVVENDLILSRYFNIAVGETSYKFDMESQIAYWENKGVSVILAGSISIADLTKLTVEAKLYDVESKELIWQKKYTGDASDYRFLAHQINDEIVKRFTGEVGIASSKISFVNNSTRFKEIYIIDYDGYNLKRITKDNRLNILPKWVPNASEVIYTSYLYNNPDLFLINIVQNKRRAISKIQGLNSPASFSPNGKMLIATLSRGVYPNLYILNPDGTIIRRLTQGKYIDTSPSFAPNSREVVFISDRPGYPQLYIMDIDGANIRRLTTKGYCDSPVWSPRGDKIVFSMKLDKYFDIFIYDLPTSKITRLTQNEKNNENPSWSQDGRFIVFSSTRSGKSEIYIMAMDGTAVRKLANMPGASFTPAWSHGL